MIAATTKVSTESVEIVLKATDLISDAILTVMGKDIPNGALPKLSYNAETRELSLTRITA